MKNVAIISKYFLSLPTYVAGLRTDIMRINSGGQFFTVVFRKKNGDLRTMNCRIGVKRHLKHGGPSTAAGYTNLLTVWDCHAKGYRNINLETVERISMAGKVVEFK